MLKFFRVKNPTTFYFTCEKSMSKHSWRTFKNSAVPLRMLEDIPLVGKKERDRQKQRQLPQDIGLKDR